MSVEEFLAQAARDRQASDEAIAKVRAAYPRLTADEAEMYHILSVTSQYGGPNEKRFQRFCALHKLGLESSDDDSEDSAAAEKAYKTKRTGAYEPIIRWKWNNETRSWYDPRAKESQQ